LESTGIFFIQHAIEQLITYFPSRIFDQESVKAYNKAVGDLMDGVREFLTIHYVCASRQDNQFWKATKTDLKLPDGLEERLMLWKERLPTNRTINPNYHGFQSMSYCVMLLGLGHWPAHSLPTLDYAQDAAALAAFQQIRRRTDYLIATLPSQYEYLSLRLHEDRALAHIAG
jgi:tryptophan halogenase